MLYVQHVEMSGEKYTRNSDRSVMFGAHTQPNRVNHTSHGRFSNHLQNVSFISTCVGGFVK